MKIALLFHGYMRQYELCFDHILEMLNIDDCDIFVYTSRKNHLKIIENNKIKWKEIDDISENHLGKVFGDKLKLIKFKEVDEDYRSATKLKFEELKFIYELLPDDIVIEQNNRNKIRKYVNYNLNNLDMNKHHKSSPWILRQSDQFIQMGLCSKMMKRYADENSINYDIVIQMRPDTLFSHQLDIKKYIEQIKANKLICMQGIDFFFASNIKVNKALGDFYKYYGKIDNIDCLKFRGFFAPERFQLDFVKKISHIFLRYKTNYLRNYKRETIKENIYKRINSKCHELYKIDFENLQQPLLHLQYCHDNLL